MSKEAMKLALEALITASGHVNNEAFVKVMMARDALVEALAEQPRAEGTLAQQALDKMAENARELGLDYEPAQQEPIDQLIHAWQAIEETSGHVLDEGGVECRMHMSVIRSAWEQMDSLVREIWDERGRP